MQTFYLSYKLLQTMFMAVVFLSLIFSLLLLFLLYELRPYMWKCYRNWNSFLFFFLFLLLNHLAYSFHQINNGEKYYELLPVPIVILWCIVGIVDFLLVRESIHLKKKMKEKVSQNSIKEALNLLPVGICYFTLNGTIKLCNSQMYRLFRTLAHKDLQKLSELREALHSNIQNEVIRLTDKKEIYLFPDGRAWNYQESEVKDKEGNVYIEAVFSDVTKQYHEKINLTRQTEKLKEISRELRYLSDNVLILTREREVLAAKTKLHDQMGAGLTAIRQSLAQENADYSNAVRLLRQAVNAIWNDNQYPLEEGEFERFLQDARTIGVKVRCTGSRSIETICSIFSGSSWATLSLVRRSRNGATRSESSAAASLRSLSVSAAKRRENTGKLGSTVGTVRDIIDHKSVAVFSIGVPVRAKAHLARKRTKALWVAVEGFFTNWASSRTKPEKLWVCQNSMSIRANV